MVDAASVEVTRMDVLKKVPVREQEPAVRAKNFDEVIMRKRLRRRHQDVSTVRMHSA